MNVERKNALILSILVFLQTLTIPIKVIMQSGTVLYIITLVLLAVYLLNNKININGLLLLGTLSLFFLISALLSPLASLTFTNYIDAIKLGFIYMMVATSKFEISYYFKVSYWFAIIGLLILLSDVFLSSSQNTINYMSMGVQLNYILIPITYAFFTSENIAKKYFSLIITFIIIGFTFIYGNRMSIIIQIVIVIIGDFTFNKWGSIKSVLFKGSIFLTVVISSLNIDKILLFALDFSNRIGFYSYSINKLYQLVNGSISSNNLVSGRNEIYEEAFNIINQSNFMPNGAGYFDTITDYVYPHNFLLQLFIEFGFLSIPLLIFLIILFVITYKKLYSTEKYFFLSLLSFSILRLSLSGSYWTEMSIWIVIGYCINYKKIENRWKIELQTHPSVQSKI